MLMCCIYHFPIKKYKFIALNSECKYDYHYLQNRCIFAANK
jgi:hypothetical protein